MLHNPQANKDVSAKFKAIKPNKPHTCHHLRGTLKDQLEKKDIQRKVVGNKVKRWNTLASTFRANGMKVRVWKGRVKRYRGTYRDIKSKIKEERERERKRERKRNKHKEREDRKIENKRKTEREKDKDIFALT